MSAVVNGTVTRRLDRPATVEESLTERDAADPPKLARLLLRILRDVATMKRRWWPRRIDYEDVAVDATGTTLYRFEHGFSGRVRWWVVDIADDTTYADLRRHADTDDETLILTSYTANVVTIRVEEAG